MSDRLSAETLAPAGPDPGESDAASRPAGLTPAIPETREVAVGSVVIGGARGLAVIAGPCVIEGEAITLRIAEALKELSTRLRLPLVFKASFDKANRTSGSSFRGIGIDAALRILERVRLEIELPVTTDVHLPEQAAAVAASVDLLQIPAFLCRQTDLLVACGATGAVVNLKKGQFLAPWDVRPAVEKLVRAGARGVLQTERGASFGYNNLVVDLRSLQVMRENGWPVVFDVTHSVQLPGAGGERSGAQREFIPALLRGAVAAGVDAVFLEVHENPAEALSDGPNMVALHELEPLLAQAQALHGFVRNRAG